MNIIYLPRLAPILGLAACVGVVSLEAQPARWIHQYGTSEWDQAARVASGPTGVYVVGETGGVLPGQTSSGSSDAYIRRYDRSGIELWTRQFGSAEYDAANAVAPSSTGVYAAGSAWGSLPGQTNAGSGDAFIRKYDLGGTELWTRQFGTSEEELASGVAADATGVYVVGYTFGTLPGQTTAGYQDAFIRKYDHYGTELWTYQFGTPGFDTASHVTCAAGAVYVFGHASLTFLPGSPDFLFLIRFTAGGAGWIRQFGSSAYDGASGVAADPTGAYVVGSTDGSLPGQTNAGLSDAFIRKYDPSGAELWTAQFGTTDNDYASQVAADSTGVYLVGSTFGSLPGQTNAGSFDAFVRKYDSGGTELWTKQFGTSEFDYGYGVASGLAGLYLVGATNGSLGGPNAGSADAFVLRLR